MARWDDGAPGRLTAPSAPNPATRSASATPKKEHPVSFPRAILEDMGNAARAQKKTLAALGWQPAEGRHIVRRLSALLSELEGLGGAAEAREIERRAVERHASAAA